MLILDAGREHVTTLLVVEIVSMLSGMSMPSPALAAPDDLEQLTGDLVASISSTPRGTLDGALQQALAHSIDAKVRAQLAVVLEGIGDAFYSLDPEWRFSYINRAAETYFGVPRQAMLHRMIWDVFPASAGTALRRRYEEVFASGEPLSFESESVGRQGRYLEFHVFPYNGGIGVSFRDWTERRQAEEELRASEARLSALANNAPACMFYQTSHSPDFHDRRVLYVSKTCERLTGIPAEDVQANPGLLYDLVLPDLSASFKGSALNFLFLIRRDGAAGDLGVRQAAAEGTDELIEEQGYAVIDLRVCGGGD